MEFEKLKKVVFEKLQGELSKNLAYHSVGHTKDVIAAAERLAKLEGINGHDITLLKTAALLHDVGFLRVYDGHEFESIKIARELLPEYGYNPEDIEKVASMIESTMLPQRPKSHLDQIIADADLDYIGRDDLFMIGQRLQYEWTTVGKISSLRDWHIKQLKFLKAHTFFTESARKLREEKKQANIRELENLLCPNQSGEAKETK